MRQTFPDGVLHLRKCHAALGSGASFIKRISSTPGRTPSRRARGEGWREVHSTRTKRWLISLLNVAKKQPTVSITRGILDFLTMAVAKEQRKTASNNSHLSSILRGVLLKESPESSHPKETVQLPV
jgi:hypothetical protein